MWKKIKVYCLLAVYLFSLLIGGVLLTKNTNQRIQKNKLVLQATTATLPTATPTPIPSPTITPSPTLTPTPLPPTNTPTPIPTIPLPDELNVHFQRYSDEYGVDKELLKRVAKCESGFNREAVNEPYLGMFQFTEQTWVSNRTEMSADTNPDLRKNAEESIKTAAYMFSRGKLHAWSGCM